MLFQRQTTLKEVGEQGQQSLQNTSVLIVGCGGLGGTIAVHLAASGIGTVHLVDFDTISVSNLHRQVYFSIEDIGKAKAKTLATFIKQRAPFTTIVFSNKAVQKNTVLNIISTADIVVDATDCLTTKYLLNDACVLTNKPFIYGSLFKFDGYVATFNVLQKNGTYSANLRDAFPEIATDVATCEEAGTLNTIVSVIASLQVNEVLKYVLKIGKLTTNSLIIYNSLENSQLKIALKKRVGKTKIKAIFNNEKYTEERCEIQHSDWCISAQELKKNILFSENKYNIISFVTDKNISYPFEIDTTMSLSDLKKDGFHLDKMKQYIFVCNKGITSYEATALLKNKFPTMRIKSLVGGIKNY